MNPKNSKRIIRILKKFESQNITWVDPTGGWPIIWARAKGTHVWDVDGRKYVDLTAGFGVCAVGYSHTLLVKAACSQLRTLMHCMGDVHPHPLKATLAMELSKITFERWSKMPNMKPTSGNFTYGKVIFCNSGFEAVEVALKTAHLATGRPGIIAFEGAYHGLGYGALNVTHREMFRKPFLPQLAQFGKFVSFPTKPQDKASVLKRINQLLQTGKYGAVLIEPIQGRGGIRIPPNGFLIALREICTKHKCLLILDEIFTGFGRTGKWFACEHEGATPDIICLGKALTGGFPMSVCIGRADLMDKAWPPSSGEAIHTSTFLGHPVGCAMALANINIIKRLRLPERAARLGRKALELLQNIPLKHYQAEIRGTGLMIGIELRRPDGSFATEETYRIAKAMLATGFITLPEGSHGNVLSITPPLVIGKSTIEKAVKTLARVIRELNL